ncbi:hypothetical protein [Microbacterium laevaniformans]|uniref:hypothetical protein n=1 Tax=Microbacterium laevaniformans TaxID=36807 RepID=UPI003D96968B
MPEAPFNLTTATTVQSRRDELVADGGGNLRHQLYVVAITPHAERTVQQLELADVHASLLTTLAATHDRAADLAAVVTGTYSRGPVDPSDVVDLSSLRSAVAELLDDAMLAEARVHVAMALDIEPSQVNDGTHADLIGFAQDTLRAHVAKLANTRGAAVINDSRTAALVALHNLCCDVCEASADSQEAAA